jgi:hypothetical protein
MLGYAARIEGAAETAPAIKAAAVAILVNLMFAISYVY